MLKLVIRSPWLFRKLMRFRRLRPWFQFDLSRLDEIQDETTFVYALQATRLPNGTYKTTNSSRFQQLDDLISSQFEPSKKPIRIHDVAASDGITTVNLAERLESQRISHEIYFSDKYSTLFTRRRGLAKVVYDNDGILVYAHFLGVVASPHLAPRFWLSRLFGRAFAGKFDRTDNEKALVLLNPRARDRIANGELHFFYYDLFESSCDRDSFDLVRCMNALNPAIFSESALKTAVESLVKSLADEGILVLGRTDPQTGVNNATLFKRTGSLIEVVARLGAGSEVEHLPLSPNIATNQESANLS